MIVVVVEELFFCLCFKNEFNFKIVLFTVFLRVTVVVSMLVKKGRWLSFWRLLTVVVVQRVVARPQVFFCNFLCSISFYLTTFIFEYCRN